MNRSITPYSRNHLDLGAFRREMIAWFESFHDTAAGYGHYLPPNSYGQDPRPQAGYFYASADIAILRTIMGEDLATSLTTPQRTQWLAYLNSFQNPTDGSFQDLAHHSQLHANGTAVGAIGALGGQIAHPVRLYEPFATPDKLIPWLESAVDWSAQWAASHLFWGGIHCFSLSSRASRPWLDTLFTWLDANLDPQTGWWRKGIPHTDRHQGLGGAAHILPVYQHHHRPFPFPRQIVDSVLALQLDAGNWHQGSASFSYLDLDALYAYDFCRQQIGDYRASDIQASVSRFSRWLLNRYDLSWSHLRHSHPHIALCLVGTLGLLQRLDPQHYTDDRPWTDIFSDPRLYRTAEIEGQS